MGFYTFVKRREEIAAKEKRDAVANAIENTTETEKTKAAKAQESALKRAKTAADREQKKAVKEAVDKALAEASGEGTEDEPKK